jgi:cytochrome c oxidase subunit 4
MGHGSGSDHSIPLKVYFNVLGALLVLTVVTVAAARVDFGALNTVIALGIASVKAGLVLSYFMHLKYDDKTFWVIFGTSIFFLLVLYFFSELDIMTRILEKNVL